MNRSEVLWLMGAAAVVGSVAGLLSAVTTAAAARTLQRWQTQR